MPPHRKGKIDDLDNSNLTKYQIDLTGQKLKYLLNNNQHIWLFLNYLKENRIKFRIVENIHGSSLIIKIKTLYPRFFIINVNPKDYQNAELKYKDLLHIKKRFLDFEDNIKRFYLLFLDPSIKSSNDVPIKSQYVNFDKILIREEFRRIINTDLKISFKKNLKEGLPIGVFHNKNRLNELTGKEWIKFTKSWFIYNPPSRKIDELMHPAKFPEKIIENFISFFTKSGDIVLDPFIGIGSTAIAAKNLNRSCFGIEINKKYVKYANLRLSHFYQASLEKWFGRKNQKPLKIKIFNEDANKIELLWKKLNLPKVNLCITSPPYWNQLNRNTIRQAKRKKLGLDTKYSEETRDLGNIEDYKKFVKAQKKIFYDVYNLMKNRGYLVIFTNNVYFNGKVYPLAFDTALSLQDKWILMEEKIWCQDNKRLLTLGFNNVYRGNRHHVYCLIFRKEE